MGFDTTYTPQVQTFALTNGGSSELMIAENNARTALLIQPLTEATVVQFGGTAGVQATGTYTFGVNPSASDTIAFNGTTYTFIAGASSGTDIHIEDTLAETLAATIIILNASGTAGVALATYSASSTVITVTYDAGGADGNAYTLGTNTGNIVRSAATLGGGSNTVGGIYLAANQQAIFNASEFPSIKKDVYVVSATNAAKTSYLVANG